MARVRHDLIRRADGGRRLASQTFARRVAFPSIGSGLAAGAIEAQAAYLASYDREHLLSQRDVIRAAFGLTVATPDDILKAIDDMMAP